MASCRLQRAYRPASRLGCLTKFHVLEVRSLVTEYIHGTYVVVPRTPYLGTLLGQLCLAATPTIGRFPPTPYSLTYGARER